MKLICIQNDIFAASDVVALTVSDSIVTVVLRHNNDTFEYDCDGKADALAVVERAKRTLLDL